MAIISLGVFIEKMLPIVSKNWMCSKNIERFTIMYFFIYKFYMVNIVFNGCLFYQLRFYCNIWGFGLNQETFVL